MSDPERVVLAGPLSRKTTYALHVNGPYGAREIENLLRMLNLQLEWFRQEEAADSAVK